MQLKNYSLTIVLITFSFFAFQCDKNSTEEPQPNPACKTLPGENETFLQNIKNVSGVVKKIGPADYYYQGGDYKNQDNKFYVEVSAKAVLPDSINSPKALIPIFNCVGKKLYTDADAGKTVTISGPLYKVGTGIHGRATTNIHLFFVLK